MLYRVLLGLVACTAIAAAQSPRASQGTATETKHLTVTPSVSGSGTRVSLIVDVAPKPKMHVYAPEQKDYIPISLTLTATEGVKVGAPVFPKAEKYVFEALKETQLVFSKPFRIVQPITLTKSPDALTITGTLRYQACDDSICYLPQDVPISWRIGR